MQELVDATIALALVFFAFFLFILQFLKGAATFSEIEDK